MAGNTIEKKKKGATKASKSKSKNGIVKATGSKKQRRLTKVVKRQYGKKNGHPTQPTPSKRRKTSSTKSSVTPSPDKARRLVSPWLKYDDLLKGDQQPLPKGVVGDRDPFFWSRLGKSKNIQEKKFHDEFDALMKDPIFSNPFGVRGAKGDNDNDKKVTITAPIDNDKVSFIIKDKWQRYAAVLSSYPRERLEAVHVS